MPDQCDDAQINDDHLHNVPPALRHGIYAETLLPGDEELHRTLIAEFHPIGALENDIVGTMTRLIWRKQNLAEFRIQCSKANWNLSLMNRRAPSVSNTPIRSGRSEGGVGSLNGL